MRAEREGLARIVLPVLGPREGKAVALRGWGIDVERQGRQEHIAFGEIVAANLQKRALGAAIILELRHGRVVISGLAVSDAAILMNKLRSARVSWWQGLLADHGPQIEKLKNKLRDLDPPKVYLRKSVISALHKEGKDCFGGLPEHLPVDVQVSTELESLNTFQELLENPESYRTRLNDIFVEEELRASKVFFDGIEKNPLTREQRLAIVTDDDRNLVVASAGSGKTSVIVGKAGWLVERCFRKPSEILLLAFAKDAQTEMSDRIGDRLGTGYAEDITVRTFHALGSSILGEATGKKPTLSKIAEDAFARAKLLEDFFQELKDTAGFTFSLSNWLISFFAEYRSPKDFKTKGSYYNYLRDNGIRSLKKEKLKSFEECEIANFLYLNGINYEYERSYEINTASPIRRQYQPDFFLPDYGIYIEHFAICENGETPPFIDKESYLQGREWKKRLHQQHGTLLVETFSYEKRQGVLLENLKSNLEIHGVEFHPLSYDQISNLADKQETFSPILRTLATFLGHYKSAGLDVRTVRTRAGDLGIRIRLEAFLRIFEPVYEKYQSWLREREEIDFEDMIVQAAECVEAGTYTNPYGYILVDEFQDIAPARARLLKALCDQKTTNQLFVVGDDWQSIFRFAGADVAIMQNFEAVFGIGERIDLGTTFRCPQEIADSATKFILENPSQLKKEVTALRASGGPCIHIGRPSSLRQNLFEAAIQNIGAKVGDRAPNARVLVLGRYKHSEPSDMWDIAARFPKLDLDYSTVHGSKGLEADYVVVVGMNAGKYGFPSAIPDDPILSTVLAKPEGHENAEERRLFYVALTRAKRHVYLIVDDTHPSSFISELREKNYQVDYFGDTQAQEVPCSDCKEGNMIRRSGRNGTFFGCSNFPYCAETIPACPSCSEGLIVPKGGKMVCLECDVVFQTCPACGAWLQEREGKHGRFLGCSNFPTCDYTQNLPGS